MRFATTRPVEPPTQDIAHIDIALDVPVVERGPVLSLELKPTRNRSIVLINIGSLHFLQVANGQNMRGQTGVTRSATNMEVFIRGSPRLVKSTPIIKQRTARGNPLPEEPTSAETVVTIISHGAVVSKVLPLTRTTIVLILDFATMPGSELTMTTTQTTSMLRTLRQHLNIMGAAKRMSLIIIIIRTMNQPSLTRLSLYGLTITWNMHLSVRLQVTVLTLCKDPLHSTQKNGLNHTTLWDLRERRKIFVRFVRGCERPVPGRRQSR